MGPRPEASGGEHIMSADAVWLATDVRLAFQDADGWVLTTEEIAAQLDASPNRIRTVLGVLDDRDVLERETEPAELWAPCYASH